MLPQRTDEYLKRFVGGQARVEGVDYLYHGELRGVKADAEELRLQFAWLAESVDFPPGSGWKNERRSYYLDYRVSSSVYEPDGLGLIPAGPVSITSTVGSQRITFYPPDHPERLDPKLVEGLALAQPN